MTDAQYIKKRCDKFEDQLGSKKLGSQRLWQPPGTFHGEVGATHAMSALQTWSQGIFTSIPFDLHDKFVKQYTTCNLLLKFIQSHFHNLFGACLVLSLSQSLYISIYATIRLRKVSGRRAGAKNSL